MVSVGLGAVLAASHSAYSIVRWVGAGYLLWLGYKMLRHPRRTFVVETAGMKGDRNAFGMGLLTNLLNPKVGIFYVSFLPQFVPHGVAVAPFILLLGAIHALLGLMWFACLIAATPSRRPVPSSTGRARGLRPTDGRSVCAVWSRAGARIAT